MLKNLFCGNDTTAKHTMYVRGTTIGTVNDIKYTTFGLTYHSINTEERDLLSIASNNKNKTFIFYDFTY